MAMKFTFLFLEVPSIGGGGPTFKEIFLKKNFLVLPLSHWRIFNLWIYVTGHGNISGKNVVANCRREK